LGARWADGAPDTGDELGEGGRVECRRGEAEYGRAFGRLRLGLELVKRSCGELLIPSPC
jgi:hypothetical protein